VRHEHGSMRCYQALETFSKLSCCLHTAEVAGSNPASPTQKSGVLQQIRALDLDFTSYRGLFGSSKITARLWERTRAGY
jgi:hypothetical protein